MKKPFILSLWILVIVCANAQKIPLSFPSPEAAGLGIVSATPVNYHTGEIDIRIPLFQLEVSKKHTVPLFMSYNSAGFRPQERPGWVGQNWTLNAGGVITRLVRGFPDERQSGIVGFMHKSAYQEMQATDWASNQKLEASAAYYYYNGTPGRYDTEPDEFYFSVNGVSGKFCFDIDGKLKAITDPSIKVERNPTMIYLLSPNNQGTTFSGFKITLNDGTICYFGNWKNHWDTGLIETTATIYNETPEKYTEATSWYLAKIVYPDTKEEVLFSYTDKLVDIHRFYYQLNILGGWQWKDLGWFSYNGNCSASGTFTSTAELHHLYLKSIETKSEKITFHTSPATGMLQLGEYNPNWKKLDSIRLISKPSGNVLRSFHLKYSERRLFLESLKESGKPAYKFRYNGGNNIGYEFDCLDHWGYYNGFHTNTMIGIPVKVEGDDNSYFRLERETDPMIVKTGIISQIDYPTGGRTLFEFESNDYSRYCELKRGVLSLKNIKRAWSRAKSETYESGNIVVRNPRFANIVIFRKTNDFNMGSISNVLLRPRTYSLSEIFNIAGAPLPGNENDFIVMMYFQELEPSTKAYTGGVRIKKITEMENGNSNSISSIREFKYVKDYEINNNSLISSGILGAIPLYNYSININDQEPFAGVYNGYYDAWSSQSFIPESLTQGKHVGYSEVVEIFNDRNNNRTGYNIYKYTNFDTNPDLPPVNVITLIGQDIGARNKKDYERGKLLSETSYNRNNGKVWQKEYKYKKTEAEPIRAVEFKRIFLTRCAMANVTGYAGIAYHIYRNAYMPYEITERTYNSGGKGMVSKTVNYEYDEYNFIKKEIKTTSISSDKTASTISYSHKMPQGVYAEMKNKNMLNYPVEVTTKKNNRVTESILTTYKPVNGFYMPHKVYRTELTSPVSSFTYFNGTTKDSHYGQYPETEYAKYDDSGNITEQKGRDGVSIAYLRSYNSRYLIAEIRGAGYADVESVLGAANISNFAGRANPSLAEIRAFLAPLSSNGKTKNALVTYYSYKPSVGIAGKTDPNGRVTVYEYDSLGRLRCIKDPNGKIIEQYDYHYKK